MYPGCKVVKRCLPTTQTTSLDCVSSERSHKQLAMVINWLYRLMVWWNLVYYYKVTSQQWILITIISQFIIYLCSIRNHSCNYILQEKDKGPCRKKSKKQLHGVVTKKGRDRDDTEISKLEKLMGMQPSNKKKTVEVSESYNNKSTSPTHTKSPSIQPSIKSHPRTRPARPNPRHRPHQPRNIHQNLRHNTQPRWRNKTKTHRQKLPCPSRPWRCRTSHSPRTPPNQRIRHTHIPTTQRHPHFRLIVSRETIASPLKKANLPVPSDLFPNNMMIQNVNVRATLNNYPSNHLYAF